MKLLYFNAPWCGPCEQQKELLKQYDATPVESINVEEDTATANKYSVRSLPKLILIDDNGSVVKSFNGLTNPSEIEQYVE